MTALLRPMRSEDLGVVIALEPELFGAGAWSRGVYEEELQRADRCYLVVATPVGTSSEPDRVIAYAGLATGIEATVMTIGVAASHRRQGHARTMLTALLDEARRTGAESVFLEVRISDDGAQALYRSFGFEPLAVRRGYYQPEGADALVMQLALRPMTPSLGPVGSEAIEE
ncbi:ribosomal protein S18-alanine N-acetyltransferase [Ruania zhangjianzhongii]|uniref:ribosomal protein S18-alanine N-acetyltransferase n=1 Tax=Ruania zhangjianzhongii TaxID=2603206 RepID=UPI0011C9F5FF|nr:ribosomal protein S18-alanine N-acetyltransferase [Ruania zhangjianzhongii]